MTNHFKTTVSILILALTSCFWPQTVDAESLVGEDLPELDIKFIGDEPELEGKPMIIEFWATWCPPCRESIPHLNQVYKKYQKKGLEIVGITEESAPIVNKFTKKVPIDYTIGIDDGGKYASNFDIEGIPHALVVNKSGKVIWEGHPLELQDRTIEKALK